MNLDDLQITGLSYDSRKVKPGDLFVAIPGFKVDGHKFIPQAIQNGASTIIAERDFDAPANIQKVIVPNSREALAKLSNRFYDFPSKKLKLIGITGTNGKTTTAYLIESILSSAGFKTGLIGTIETKVAGVGEDVSSSPSMTTPESLELQALLSKMLKEGVTHVVMEVSSHSLAQYRVYGCEFDVAIYTNLTHDHLDFHKTMENYLEEKKKLFKMIKPSGLAIVNVDDPYSKDIISEVEGEVIFYGLKDGKHELKTTKYSEFDFRVKEIFQNVDQMRVKIDSMEIKTNLIGEYNVYNILAAFQCGLAFGLSRAIIKKGIEKAKVPGRLEQIDCGQPFKVFVDFAHSPDALEKLLTTLRQFTKGKLVLVFGCPGDRDKDKRPIMGKIALELADHVIVTTDDPHSEDPSLIIDEIRSGMSDVRCPISNLQSPISTFFSLIDRKEAIKKALTLATSHDIVAIAGRGHEKYQDFNGNKIYLDDREYVKEVMSNLGFVVKLCSIKGEYFKYAK